MKRQAGINLLPTADDSVVRQRTIARVMFLILVVVLIATLVGYGLLWSTALLGRRQLRREEERIQVLQAHIGSNSPIEQQYHLVANRLQAAESIMTTRLPLDSLMKQLAEVVPPEASLISAKFSDVSSAVDIRVSFSTLSGLDDLMNRVQSGSASRVIVVQEYRMQDGTIQFDLRLSLT